MLKFFTVLDKNNFGMISLLFFLPFNNLNVMLIFCSTSEFEWFQPSSSSSSSFDSHVEKTKTILKEVQRLEQKAEDILNQAFDMECELMNQSLVDGPSPSLHQMKEIEELHQQSQALVGEMKSLSGACHCLS